MARREHVGYGEAGLAMRGQCAAIILKRLQQTVLTVLVALVGEVKDAPRGRIVRISSVIHSALGGLAGTVGVAQLVDRGVVLGFAADCVEELA